MALRTYSLQQNKIEDLSQDSFPSIVTTWQGKPLELPATGTHIGYVYQGHPYLSRRSGAETYQLHPGMYFCLPEPGSIQGEHSAGIVITCLNYQGLFSLGGAIEPTGRLAYIDGATNSLLIPPLVLGDPCLNVMYFPSQTEQTLHTHPSYRIGIVVEGEGECKTLESSTPLGLGTIFLIPADTLHQFRTAQSKLTVVVFHPDSDTGFAHQNNPMLKRTLISGVSAADLPQIQTKVAKN